MILEIFPPPLLNNTTRKENKIKRKEISYYYLHIISHMEHIHINMRSSDSYHPKTEITILSDCSYCPLFLKPKMRASSNKWIRPALSPPLLSVTYHYHTTIIPLLYHFLSSHMILTSCEDDDDNDDDDDDDDKGKRGENEVVVVCVFV